MVDRGNGGPREWRAGTVGNYQINSTHPHIATVDDSATVAMWGCVLFI